MMIKKVDERPSQGREMYDVIKVSIISSFYDHFLNKIEVLINRFSSLLARLTFTRFLVNNKTVDNKGALYCRYIFSMLFNTI